MDTAEIRRRFLAHFEAAGHAVVDSASTLADDPNLLFVNAGMVPFKPYFLGQETPPFDRATSVQKCIRTPDIEDVGKTTRHATFFEMCGNFSFGDYFKEGAIELAWDLVTKPGRRRRLRPRQGPPLPLGAGRRRGGHRALDEGHRAAARADRPARPQGELLVDGRARVRAARARRSSTTAARTSAPTSTPPRSAPTCRSSSRTGCWRSGTSSSCRTTSAPSAPSPTSTSPGSLPKKNIDTGMGLDRVALLLQGKKNMYEIDLAPPGHRQGRAAHRQDLRRRPLQDDVRFCVVADHVRSSMMLIGDGVTPGNDGRGYVLRRLLRRAVRSMRLLGLRGPGAARADAGLPRRDGPGLRQPRHRLGAHRAGGVRRGGRVPQDAPVRHPDLRPGRRRGEADRRDDAVRRARLRAPRHLRLPDRPHPRDGGRAGPRRSTSRASAA